MSNLSAWLPDLLAIFFMFFQAWRGGTFNSVVCKEVVYNGSKLHAAEKSFAFTAKASLTVSSIGERQSGLMVSCQYE
jgi:hypothetical protein